MIKEWCILLLTLMIIHAEDNSCPDQFMSIGKFCYHFSDVEMNWEAAGGACKGIGSFINETILPAVLDFGSTRENQLLLTEVYNKSQDYWLGGKKIYMKWKWVSQNEIDIDLHANYWASEQPNTDGKCIKATSTWNKTSIATEDCSSELRVICQIIPNQYGFRDIGNHKYYFSEKNNKDKTYWENARNVCQSIVPPQDFDYVDLAILSDDTDQQLLQIIAQHGNETWLGGVNSGPMRADGKRLYAWLDARVIEETSYFWNDDKIWYSSWSRDMVVYATTTSSNGYQRAVLETTGIERGPRRKFVCQAYTNPVSNQG